MKRVPLLCVLLVSTVLLAADQNDGLLRRVMEDLQSRKQLDAEKESEVKTITVTNWHYNHEVMEVLHKEFMKKYPHIRVLYKYIENVEYDETVISQLKNGEAPDIIYLRSFAGGREFFDTGKIAKLDELLPQLKTFSSTARGAWETEDGSLYAVPSAGVIHGVFYHKDIFIKHGLSPPETWEEFIAVCNKLKEEGENVFALGTKDYWFLNEVLFSGLGANFYGGEESRIKLINRTMYMKDPLFIEAFKKMKELEPYLPENYEDLGYSETREMFIEKKAAMYIGGSWDIWYMERKSVVPDSVGFFGPPVENKGDRTQLCFHMDYAIGLNSESRNREEAELYMEWVVSQEYAQLMMELSSGFFSFTPGNYSSENSVVSDMLQVIAESDFTIRTLWEKFSDSKPSGNELLGEAMINLYNEDYSPQEAAEYVHRGLQWYYK